MQILPIRIHLIFPLLSLPAIWRQARLLFSEKALSWCIYPWRYVPSFFWVPNVTSLLFSSIPWSVLGEWVSLLTNIVGYQFDYVFDWTALKYPQMSSNNKLVQVCLFSFLFVLFGLHSWWATIVFSFHKRENGIMFFIQQPSARITGAGPSGERTDKPSSVSPCSWLHLVCCYMRHWLICIINYFFASGTRDTG